MSKNSSNSSIMSIAEMIDNAFGDVETNTVNHKLLQTVLYILARQLRVLERRVAVNMAQELQITPSTLSVTEIKIHASTKKKRKIPRTVKEGGLAEKSGRTFSRISGRSGDVGVGGADGKRGFGGVVGDLGGKDGGKVKGGFAGVEGKKSTDRSSSDKSKSTTEKTSSGKGTTTTVTTDMSSWNKTSSDKTSSAKASSEPMTTDLSSWNKTSSDKTSSAKTSSEPMTTDMSSWNKTSSDKTSSAKASSEPISSDKTSSAKASSEPISSDKTSSAKTSSEPISSDKTSSAKTSSEPFSSDKTSSAKTTSDPTSSDKTSSAKISSEPISSDKISSAKTSSDPTSSDKTFSKDQITSSDKRLRTTTSESSKKRIGSAANRGLGFNANILDEFEMEREAELRVIHQRAVSQEGPERTPTPIASLESLEVTYEKLLVVERVSSDQAKARGRKSSLAKIPEISVVTQEQFENLSKKVQQLQEKLAPVGTAAFPENIKLMDELRKGASLTDAMAALQLAARLDATEMTMNQMVSLVTELAKRTQAETGDMEVLFDAHGKHPASKASRSRHKYAGQKSFEESTMTTLAVPTAPVEPEVTAQKTKVEDRNEMSSDLITYEELQRSMQILHKEIKKMVHQLLFKSSTNADKAFKLANKLESRLEEAINLNQRMDALESLVDEYSEQINTLDTGLSSQMTNYQEELTQMQHDLETAVETMAEVLANSGGDTTAVAELNAHFTNFSADIDDTLMRQNNLKDTQNTLAIDLESLRKQIEIISDIKSDREEVIDALRDKAGIRDLNGKVSIEQFQAVRGFFEQRIVAAYDKFNGQEIIWQKMIDNLMRDLNEKADIVQVESLKDDINRHLENFRRIIHPILEILGEPKAAAVAKKLHRDAACLSCATPADIELEEKGIMLPSVRPPAVGDEAQIVKESGDYKPCYPGLPITHARDPRAHFCKRWCGGSHTAVSNTGPRAPAGMTITPVMGPGTTALGTDGKAYKVDEIMKPRAEPKVEAVPLSPEVLSANSQADPGSNMMSSDMRLAAATRGTDDYTMSTSM